MVQTNTDKSLDAEDHGQENRQVNTPSFRFVIWCKQNKQFSELMVLGGKHSPNSTSIFKEAIYFGIRQEEVSYLNISNRWNAEI